VEMSHALKGSFVEINCKTHTPFAEMTCKPHTHKSEEPAKHSACKESGRLCKFKKNQHVIDWRLLSLGLSVFIGAY